MSLREGTTLDHRYVLIQRLGEGGQGSVWKAFDRNTGAERALKIVHLPEKDGEAAERARREAHLVKDARHPAVVACHSLFEIPSEDVLVLVFDFVQATSLADVLGDERFGRAHKLAALRHIAGALAFLHARGVVHRDLKPDNILVTPVFWEDPAAPSALKLIDFGIAAPRRGPDGATLSGMFGTPPYMAPELFEVAGIEAQRSPTRDVFSFGVIGWEMLDGRHPTGLPHGSRAGAFQASYLYQRRSSDPWPPRQLEGRWGSVIAACLALDPGARPHDGRAILALLDGAPETPPPGQVAGASRSPVEQAQRPQIRTDPHVPPAPERTVGEPQVREGSARPAPSPRGTAEPTEIAPASSLPRSSAVEHTTPMPPEIVHITPEAPRKATASPARPPPPSPEDDEYGERSTTGTWQVLVMGLVLLSLVAAGTAWLLLGGRTPGSDMLRSPEGSPSASGPETAAPPPPSSGAPISGPPSITATGAPAGTATAFASAAATPPIEVCCPQGEKQCKSGRTCKAEGCATHDVPERTFLLRVIAVKEWTSPYEEKRNLADAGALPESMVCVQADAGEACATMRDIASEGGAWLARAPDGKNKEALRVPTSELKKGGLRLRILDRAGKPLREARLTPTGGLRTTALCGSLNLKDKDARLFLSVHLDDPND